MQILDAAVELGLTNWDTSDVYGDNEDLLGKWCVMRLFRSYKFSMVVINDNRFKYSGKRDKLFLATKFGGTPKGPNGKPEYVRFAIERSLKRLEIETIDLYYIHVCSYSHCSSGNLNVILIQSALSVLIRQLP